MYINDYACKGGSYVKPLRILLFILLTLLVASLAACGGEEAYSSEEVRALVDEYSANFETSERAAITSHELIVTSEDDEETRYDLPEDAFFVSIAPYYELTHP